jgi:hypothetical protein
VSFTVVPLHNLALEKGTRIPFADGIVFQDVPEWVREESFLNYLSHHDRQSVLEASQAFVAEYEASAIGEPDPSWMGDEPKAIQDIKTESALLANLALWLRQPSSVCLTVILHAISWKIPGQDEREPLIQRSESQIPIYCHPNDLHNPLTPAHLTKAAELHRVLCSVPRDSAVRTAIRALWTGLTSQALDIRYSLLWVALEALFGANESGEIAYKLSQRIAFFLANTPEEGRGLFQTVKKCYGVRSKIVHGRWKPDPEADQAMGHTESILRTSIRRLLEDPEMMRAFCSKHRDKFLEDWVFFRYTDPPPFPTM